MALMQQIIVADHIAELRCEAARLRTERLLRPARDPARVRLGHWLMTVGATVAGTSGDRQAGHGGGAAITPA